MSWKPEKLADNRTTTNQQKNQHSHGPEEKKTTQKKKNISRREGHRFSTTTTLTRCPNEKKKQANAWAGRVIFHFPFYVSRLSFSPFPRTTTTTKNIKNSVDRRWGTRSTLSPSLLPIGRIKSEEAMKMIALASSTAFTGCYTLYSLFILVHKL